jgi:hypothetical protein
VGTFTNYLYGVDAVSANDVWAVGAYADSTGPAQTLVLHWDGTAWTVVPSPNRGTTDNKLYGVAAVSANDAWAVGFGSSETLVAHWNGSVWTAVPGTGPGALFGITAVSANDVWAVGGSSSGTLVEHWNGTAWSVVPSPSPGERSYLLAVAATSANDVWAVGEYTSSGRQTLVEHWNGTAWAVVPSPNVGIDINTLRGVAAASANDVWAVGYYSGNGSGALVERYALCPPPPTATPTATPTPRCPGEVFSDVCPTDYFYTPVMYLYNNGVISGYADGTFRPYNDTTRGQFAKIIVLAEAWPIVTPAGPPTFADVPATHPFYPYVETAVSHGIISGYADGTFRPGNPVTRGQLCKMIVLAEAWPVYTPTAPTFGDVPPSHPFFRYIETAYQRGILSGYTCGPG